MSFPVFEYCTSVFGSSGIEEKNIFRYIVQEEKKIVKAQHNTPKTKITR